jgi:hypothetical protein
MLLSNRSNNESFNTIQYLMLMLISHKFNLIIFPPKSIFFSFCGSKSYRSCNTFLNITRLRPFGLLQQYRFGSQIGINKLFYLITLDLQIDDNHPFMPISRLLEDNTALQNSRDEGIHYRYLLIRLSRQSNIVQGVVNWTEESNSTLVRLGRKSDS